jgi:nucleotide-binding universal stress UspA family protein
MMSTSRIRRPVVVGVDGSENALRAARWGAAEAERRRVPLRLVMAFAWTVDEVATSAGLEERYRVTLLDRARGHLALAASAARGVGVEVEVEWELVVGHPIPVLDTESAGAQLIVVGDTGLGRVAGMHLGSVTVAMAAYASCPVVVVRGAGWEPSGTSTLPVLVGVYGAPTSEVAVAFAFEAAALRGVPLLAVHTWGDLVVDLGLAPLPEWDAFEVEERVLMTERLAGWIQKYPEVPVEMLVTRDRPAHGLLPQAARAQLVVLGSRRRGEFAGSVLGSVGNAMLHRAPCPVAVVRLDADVLA